MQPQRRQRNTRQRQVLLAELRKVKSHPTATELYQRVRRHLPRISLGTVYRNLDLLTKSGLVRRLEVDGSGARFDGNLERHCHVRCIGCGKVDDIHGVTDPTTLDEAGALTDYEILGHRLDFFGLCPECKSDPTPKES